MAFKTGTDNQYTLARNLWTLYGKGVGGGAATTGITLTEGIGMSATVTQATTGIYVVTLSTKWNRLLGFNANVLSTTTGHFEIRLDAETVATTKLVTFRVFYAASGAAPALASLATTDTLMFQLYLSDTTQVPKVG